MIAPATAWRRLTAYLGRYVPPWLYQEWRWRVTGVEQQLRFARMARADRRERNAMSTDEPTDREMTELIAELASALGASVVGIKVDSDLGQHLSALFGDDKGKPEGLTDDQEMALAVDPDGVGTQVVYTDLDSLMAAWATHLGADTDRPSAGVVALEMAGTEMVMWARTWNPDEYDLDDLEPNPTAGFIWWMADDHHHLPIFGTVLLTGRPAGDRVDGLSAWDLLTLEETIRADARQGPDDVDRVTRRAALGERFREGARDGMMFQDTGELARAHMLPTDPSTN